MTFTAKAARVIATRPRLGGFTAKRRGLNKEAARRPAPGRTANAKGVAVLSPYAMAQAGGVIRHP